MSRLDEAVARIRKLSAQRQDEIAQMLEEVLEQGDDEYRLTPEQEEQVREAIARADRGEFASDKEVEALFRKFDI